MSRVVNVLGWLTLALIGAGNLIVLTDANSRIQNFEVAYLAEAAWRALPLCKQQAEREGINLNPFSALDPKSVSIIYATSRVDLSTGDFVGPSRLQFLSSFSYSPEKYIPAIELLIDLSDRQTDLKCATRLYTRNVTLMGREFDVFGHRKPQTTK
jgi:hypothetical protein